MTTDSIPSFSQVTVSVDDQSWKEVSSFADYGPDAHVYIVAIDPATGAATISFGDGKYKDIDRLPVQGLKLLIGMERVLPIAFCPLPGG